MSVVTSLCSLRQLEAIVARAGQAISNPVSGERVEYRQTSAATGGALLQWVHVLEPGRRVPADHVHWAQEERFEILSGTATVRLGKETLILKPDDDLVIPAGTAHGLRNEGTVQLRVLTELRPAMRTEQYFETVFGLAHDGKVDKRGLPNLLRGSVIVRDLGEKSGVAGVPIGLTNVLTALFALVGRRLGYRAVYPKYTDINS
jgi:mannose-6-phosphate isomerase-like protein (cupin superfamily)